MSGHTPGPWKIDRRRSWDEVRDAKGIVLAQVTGLGRDAQEAQANARLIAAAPNLYEALKALDAACNLRALRGRDHVPSMRAEQEARQQAAAALARVDAL